MFKKLAAVGILLLFAITAACAAPASARSGGQAKPPASEIIEKMRRDAKEYVEKTSEAAKAEFEKGKSSDDVFGTVESIVKADLPAWERTYSGYGVTAIYRTDEIPESGGVKRFEELMFDCRTGLVRSLVRIYDADGTMLIEESAAKYAVGYLQCK